MCPIDTMVESAAMFEDEERHFDVAVIGGGPAGMMAAGRAAELGASVILLEKNGKVGRKLLLTGKGRCNIAQAILDAQGLVEKFGRNGRFLFSSLSIFSPIIARASEYLRGRV